MKKLGKAISWVLLLVLGVSNLVTAQGKVSGITVVAPPRPITAAEFVRIKEANAEWVAFVPYGFQRKGQSELRYNLDMQWWGERIEGVRSCIELAKTEGLKVMLKPQVYMPGGWVGDMDFESEKDWLAWEKDYRVFINAFLDIAIEYEVELFCIGTEYKIATKKREAFWRSLIQESRDKYKGKITYSSNWDAYKEMPLWDELDYIGISAYFPLSNKRTPKINVLRKKWKDIDKELRNFSNKLDKEILFTEYGYLTTDKCAWRAWEIEKEVYSLPVNQTAQANAFEALYQSLVSKSYWQGGFIWKWFPAGMGHEGYPDKDYTPQDKKSEAIVAKWYEEMNKGK